MARGTYQSKDDAGHKYWTARYGRYVIRIDASRPAPKANPTRRLRSRWSKGIGGQVALRRRVADGVGWFAERGGQLAGAECGP
jgi:hypothetical protein